jgi:hypothetical protein
MGSKKVDYRGYEIWEWDEGEKVPGKVYTAESKGERPDLSGYMKSVDAVKKLIDDKLDTGPVKVEEYRGVDIYYRGDKEMYEAKIGKRRSRRKDLGQLKKIIDRKMG